ncbi:MAG: hypothetical protein P8O86_09505, partial [Actinomycetota bacterium]|nr:hypothetical protein [Actinomycetota bacterium]
MGIRRNILRLLALLFAFSMIAAACGGSDSDSDSSSGEASSSSSEAAEAEEEGEEEDTGGTLSQDAIEKAVSGDDDDAEAAEEVASDCPVDRSTVQGIFAEADCSRNEIIAMITAKMDAGE